MGQTARRRRRAETQAERKGVRESRTYRERNGVSVLDTVCYENERSKMRLVKTGSVVGRLSIRKSRREEKRDDEIESTAYPGRDVQVLPLG